MKIMISNQSVREMVLEREPVNLPKAKRHGKSSKGRGKTSPKGVRGG